MTRASTSFNRAPATVMLASLTEAARAWPPAVTTLRFWNREELSNQLCSFAPASE